MAKKKQSATTVSSASGTAKRSPLSNTAIRLFGAILAFVGILLCIAQSSVVNMMLTVFAVGCLLGGFFVAVSNLRKMISSKSTAGDVLLYFFIGIIVLILGVLLIVFKSEVSKWFIIIVGALIAVYGLAMLIKCLIRRRSKKALIFDIVIAILTIIAGVLIALLSMGEVSGAEGGICYYIFGSIATVVGVTELIAY